jgi:hypothetical protein
LKPANGLFRPATPAVVADLPCREAGPNAPPEPRWQLTRLRWRGCADVQRFSSTSPLAWPRSAAQVLAAVADLVACGACRRVGALFASHLRAGSRRRDHGSGGRERSPGPYPRGPHGCFYSGTCNHLPAVTLPQPKLTPFGGSLSFVISRRKRAEQSYSGFRCPLR